MDPDNKNKTAWVSFNNGLGQYNKTMQSGSIITKEQENTNIFNDFLSIAASNYYKIFQKFQIQSMYIYLYIY